MNAIPSSDSSALHRFTRFSAVLVAIGLLACDDTKKLAEKEAAEELVRLAPKAKEAALEVRKGLPAAASQLGKLLDPDTLGNNSALQKAIAAARSSSKDLNVSKITFLSFADATGTVLRSEADPDLLAAKSVFVPFPALKKAVEAPEGPVEAFGEMAEMRGLRTGPDAAWVLAHPVKDDKGGFKGIFVTGWSMRRFAAYLEDTAKRQLNEASQKAGKKTVPLVYVFAVKGKAAYGAILTPDVNTKAIEDLNVFEKTAGGAFHSNLEITGRTFGVAAERTPELGNDAAIALLLSEL